MLLFAAVTPVLLAATPDLAISSQHQFILQYPASSANMLFVTSAHESCFYYNLQYVRCKIWWTKCYWGLSASCLNILLFAATVLSEVTKDQLLCLAKLEVRVRDAGTWIVDSQDSGYINMKNAPSRQHYHLSSPPDRAKWGLWPRAVLFSVLTLSIFTR